MERFEKLKSVRVRLFATLCISVFLLIFCLIIVNNVLLEGYYTYSKAETAIEICEDINMFYNGVLKYDINEKIEEQEKKNNLDILIMDDNFNIIYCNNQELVSDITVIKPSIRTKIIYKKDKMIIMSIQENRNNKYLLLSAQIDNGYNVYIKIQTQPIKETVKISNKLLIIIGTLMILISAVISSIIANKFTKPILELNKITKRMANLDFSQKYRISDTEDEINMLGRNINEMSDKL